MIQNKTETNEDREAKLRWKSETARFAGWTLAFLGGLFFFWGLRRFYDHGYSKPDLANLGSFLQGAAASLWSLAAFMLVYAALVEQQLQRLLDEREQHRDRLQGTFFQLLSFQSEIVRSFYIKHVKYPQQKLEEFHGVACFIKWCSILQSSWGTKRHAKQSEDISIAIEAYDESYPYWQSDLGHYFRNLYHIFRLVDESVLDVKEKEKISRIGRAQLSNFELVLLFYNGLSEKGAKFKPLIEKYKLLDNLPESLLLHRGHLTAYGHLKHRYQSPAE